MLVVANTYNYLGADMKQAKFIRKYYGKGYERNFVYIV